MEKKIDNSALEDRIGHYLSVNRLTSLKVRLSLPSLIVVAAILAYCLTNFSAALQNSYLRSTAGVMFVLVLVNMALALTALRRTHRTAAALSSEFRLPQKLSKCLEVTDAARLKPIATIWNEKGLRTEERLEQRRNDFDERAVGVIDWVAQIASAVANSADTTRPSMASYYLSFEGLSVGDDFRQRTTLNALTHFLLFIGIVITLLSLFYAFSQENIAVFIEPLAKGNGIDREAFGRVMHGFTLAFGATAIGYLAYLAARYQTDLAEQDSEAFAELLRNGILVAFKRALVPFAVTTPASLDIKINSSIHDQIKASNKSLVDEIKLMNGNIGKEMRSLNAAVAEETKKLVYNVAGQIAELNKAIAGNAAEDTSRIMEKLNATLSTALQLSDGFAKSVGDASKVGVNFADFTNQISAAAQQIGETSRTTAAELNALSQQLTAQGVTLLAFSKDADIKAIQQQLAEGRRSLGTAVEHSTAQMASVVGNIKAMLYQFNAASAELREQLRAQSKESDAQFSSLERYIQNIETLLVRLESRRP
jgi:hypothetical protein